MVAETKKGIKTHVFDVWFPSKNQTLFITIADGEMSVSTCNVVLVNVRPKDFAKITIDKMHLSETNPKGDYVDAYKACYAQYALQQKEQFDETQSVAFCWLREDIQSQISAAETLYVDTHGGLYQYDGTTAIFDVKEGKRSVHTTEDDSICRLTVGEKSTYHKPDKLSELMGFLAMMSMLECDSK